MTLSLLAFEHIAKKNGINRISKAALEELRYIMEERANEVAHDAIMLCKHANRLTIKKEDIALAARRR